MIRKFSQKIILSLLIFTFVFGVSAITLPNQVLAQTEDTTSATEKGLSSDNPGFWVNPLSGIVQTGFSWIALTVLKFASLLTGLGGVVLNNSINYTIVDVKDNYDKIKSIDTAWKVVRDVSNMAFIFVLLYAAIQTILGIGQNTQRLIVRVVVVAILINFSLFFTKFVIDTSNVLALTFYDAMVPATTSKGLISTGISDAFMNAMNLQRLYKLSDGQTLGIGEIVGTGIMGTILLLIAAFIFFAIALMFLIRYVVLILVLILSPIAFIAFVLDHPQVQAVKKQWTDALIGQAFFAPIYMMLTWITLKVLSGITASNVFQATGDLSKFSNPAVTIAGNQMAAQGFFGTIINYIVVIIFLMASLIIAKQSSGKLPGGAGKLMDSAMSFAGGSTLGLAGRFGRGTVGRLGQKVADSEYLKDRPDSMAARLTLAAGRKTAGTSFDLRNTGVGSVLDAGKGNKGGFADDMKRKIKEEKEYADNFKPSDLTILRKETELNNIKKTGTAEQITEAQGAVDKLKGVNEDEMRKRKAQELIDQDIRSGVGQIRTEKQATKEIKDKEGRRLGAISRMTIDNPKMTRKEAEEEVDKMITEGKLDGIKIDAIKSATNERKETYAKDRESGTTKIPLTGISIPHFDIGGRVMAVGAIKKERLAVADAIRKSMKEKKSADKIVEEIQNAAKKEVEDAEPETPAPAPAPEAPKP